MGGEFTWLASSYQMAENVTGVFFMSCLVTVVVKGFIFKVGRTREKQRQSAMVSP